MLFRFLQFHRGGSAIITVEYDWNKDMDEAFLDLQKELNSFSQNSDLESFTISQYDPNASPVMIVGLKNDRITNMDELRKVAENYIRNELVRIEGVADVRLVGKEESEVVIETNKYCSNHSVSLPMALLPRSATTTGMFQEDQLSIWE